MKTYIVYRPVDGQKLSDGQEIKAHEYDHAARKWADDRSIRGRREIRVVDKESKIEKIFLVYGELTPTYYAAEICNDN